MNELIEKTETENAVYRHPRYDKFDSGFFMAWQLPTGKDEDYIKNQGDPFAYFERKYTRKPVVLAIGIKDKIEIPVPDGIEIIKLQEVGDGTIWIR